MSVKRIPLRRLKAGGAVRSYTGAGRIGNPGEIGRLGAGMHERPDASFSRVMKLTCNCPEGDILVA
jgi:hypothetical protein